MSYKRFVFSVFAMALLLVANKGVLAHHSFAAFDQNKEVTISGTVVEVQYTNPHAWVFVDVVDEDGNTDTWAVEAGGPNILMRIGWKKNTVKVGDKVEVVINPMRDTTKKGGSFVKFTLSDGTVIEG